MVGRPSGSITLADIANVAGVSPGTVSRALNGRDGVNAETRDRVQEVARRLGYQPNALARGLLSGRSYTVGLITTDSFGRFSIPVMLGAEDALGAGQMSVLLCDGRDDPIRERHYLRTLLERRVDGIIVTGRRTDPRPPIGSDLGVPVVYAMTQSTSAEDLSITPDDLQGGALAVGHLIGTGRRYVAHVTGPERFQAARLRAQGALAQLEADGGSLVGGQVFYGEWTEQWGRQAAAMLLDLVSRGAELDAVFCGNDQIARGMLDIFREAGVAVPDDVAVMGFDNWEIIAAASRPPLTTVDMDLREVGRLAAESLLEAIAGNRDRGVRTNPCRLVIRDSTGPGRGIGSSAKGTGRPHAGPSPASSHIDRSGPRA